MTLDFGGVYGGSSRHSPSVFFASRSAGPVLVTPARPPGGYPLGGPPGGPGVVPSFGRAELVILARVVLRWSWGGPGVFLGLFPVLVVPSWSS